jgi:hypothetical protein
VCDYSLYAVTNRLAEDGEELVLHRFMSGSLGFAAPGEVRAAQAQANRHVKGFWAKVKALLTVHCGECVTAVCIPPGSRLKLVDVPLRIQSLLGIRDGEEAVLIERSTESHQYRDALLFRNGRRVLLQHLPEGIRTIYSAVPEQTLAPDEDEVYA